MNKFTYKIIVEVDMEIIPSVKEMLDSVNNTMTAFGFSDTKLKSLVRQH